jgi:hypothetical protein
MRCLDGKEEPTSLPLSRLLDGNNPEIQVRKIEGRVGGEPAVATHPGSLKEEARLSGRALVVGIARRVRSRTRRE